MIDPAVLRKGRLDIQILIPAPDFETRKVMFRKQLLSEQPVRSEELMELTSDSMTMPA